MNLLRLKSSPLLLDGFEEFAIEWLGEGEMDFGFESKDEFEDYLRENGPPEVRKYWEIGIRWPQCILGDRFQPGIDQERKNDFILFDLTPVTIYYQLRGKNKGMWAKRYDDEKDRRMTSTIAQALVTFGLLHIIRDNSVEFRWDSGSELLPQFETIHHLIWADEWGFFAEPIKFYCHPKGLLWFVLYKKDPYETIRMARAKSQELEKWFQSEAEKLVDLFPRH